MNPVSTTSSLQGKAALVTGGGRGIGRAISLQLAQKQITALAITYVGNEATAQDVAAQCLKLGAKKTITVKADVTDPNIGPKLIDEVLSGLDIKTLDIIVNNAALVEFELNEPFEKTTAEGFSKTMRANCFAPMSIIRAALPYLPARNGRIINISSTASRSGPPDPVMSYGASKAALDSITRSLAMTYARKHLATFNSVSVGLTRTEAMEKAFSGNYLSDAFREKMLDISSAEARVGEPEDVAMVVAWLASDESRWINGASVMANGGDRTVISAQG